MTDLKKAVLRQVVYAQSVREIIRLVLGRLLKGDWLEYIFASSDEEFKRKLDESFKTVDLTAPTKKDFCDKVVAVLCDEVAKLCETLRDVCATAGYGDYYAAYISHERFVRLVLSVDTVKIGKMRRIVENKNLTPIEILREIGALLNDEPLEVRHAETERELKKSNAEILRVVKATKKTLVEKVDAVAADVRTLQKPLQKALRKRKTTRRKCSARQIEAASVAWRLYNESEAAHANENTRPTYKAAFEHSRRALEAAGIDSCETFKKLLRSSIVHRSRKNAKAIEARREAWRKSQSAKQVKPPRKNDIISQMTKTAKTTILMGAAIALGLASPLRSDASQALTGGGVELSASRVAASCARPDAIGEPARAEVRGRVVKVADGDTITVLAAANAQHKIRLYGIDAPESKQAFGQKSKEQLSNYVFGKDVVVKYKSRDKYGRVLGTVYVDGKDINLEMLKAGLAHHYKRYDSTPAYAQAEAEARQNKLGLWADKNPIEPYEFRKRRRQK